MTALTEFLLARIAEDEDAAQDCGVNQWVPTFRGGLPAVELAPDSPYERVVVSEVRPRRSPGVGIVRGYQAHIARHDPARVLAECDAKRAIVEQAAAMGDDGEYSADYMPPRTRHAGSIAGEAVFESARIYPGHPNFTASVIFRQVLKALSAVYADHPDYREEWAL